MALAPAIAPNPFITGFPAKDTFNILGIDMPGKWILVSATKEFGWQVQQGYGFSGAVVLPIGDPLVKAKFKGEFFASTDVILFKAIRARLLIKPTLSVGLVSFAYSITHPELNNLGVSSVVVKTIAPLIDEGGGLWTSEIEFLQYRRPFPVGPLPTQETPAVAETSVTAVTNSQVELAKLSGQVTSANSALFGKR